MNRSSALFALLLFLVLFSGCGKAEKGKNASSLIDVNRAPEVLIFDKDKNEPTPLPASSADMKMSVVLHPDMRDKSKMDEVMALSANGKEDSQIILRPLARYMDSRYYILILAVINNSNKGRNVLIYRYAYDKKGRLVSSAKENRYLASKEQHIARLTFRRGGREVRWVIKATFRR